MSRTDLSYPVGLCVIPPPPEPRPRRSYRDYDEMDEEDYYEEMYMYQRRARPKPKPVPLKSVEIETTIDGFVADVITQLKYHNEEDSAIEAKFVLPIDTSSAVYYFEAKLDKRTVIGECQDKNQARETYRDAQQAGHTAFLMERDRKNKDVFEVAVGNLAPKKDCTITFRFVRQLEVNPEGGVSFTAPLIIPLRYTPPGDKEDEDEAKALAAPKESTSSSSAFQSHLSSMQKKFGMGKFGLGNASGTDKAPYTLAFSGTVRSLNTLTRVESASKKDEFDLQSVDSTETKVVLKNDFEFDHDLSFTLYFENPFNPQVFYEPGVSLHLKNEEKQKFLGHSVAMVNLFPKLKDSDFNANHEFIFIIDRSGSMMGGRITSAKEALLLFLKSLPAGCYFNILGFGTNYEVLFDEGSRLYTEESLDVALKHQEAIEANMGSTNILEPLQYVYARPVKEGFARKMLVLTDGSVSNSKKVIETVQENCQNTRVFTFGIGEGASSALVKGMARGGLGKYEFVLGEERLQSKVMQVLMCAMQDSVTDLKTIWKFSGSDDVINVPETLPSLYSGDKLVQYAIFPNKRSQMVNNQSISVMLKGKVGDRDLEYEVPVKVIKCEADAQRAFPVHRLTAREQIQVYEDAMDNYMSSDRHELVRKITQFSIAANIASSQTSFVAVDTEKREPIEIVQRPVPYAMDMDPYMMMRKSVYAQAYPPPMMGMGTMTPDGMMSRGRRSRSANYGLVSAACSAPPPSRQHRRSRVVAASYNSMDSDSVVVAASASAPRLARASRTETDSADSVVVAASASAPKAPPPKINFRTQRQKYYHPGLEQTDGAESDGEFTVEDPDAKKMAPGVIIVKSPPRKLRRPRTQQKPDDSKSEPGTVLTVENMEIDGPAKDEPPRVPPITTITTKVAFDGDSAGEADDGPSSRRKGRAVADCDGDDVVDAPPPARAYKPPIATAASSARPAIKKDGSLPGSLSALVKLQKFNGSWFLDDDLATVLGKPLEELFHPAPFKIVFNMVYTETMIQSPLADKSIWGTALVISYLRKFLAQTRVEWELIERKGMDWLRTQDLQDMSAPGLEKEPDYSLKAE